MLAQVQHGQKKLQDRQRVSSVVIMGGGEPLANLDEVLRFMRLCHEPGILDMGYRSFTVSTCGLVPGIRVAAPRDEQTLRQALRDAVAVSDGPTVVRYPKGRLAEPLPAVERFDGIDLLHADPDPQVLLVGVGSLAGTAREAAAKLAAELTRKYLPIAGEKRKFRSRAPKLSSRAIRVNARLSRSIDRAQRAENSASLARRSRNKPAESR